jgi:predicted transposase/invertase (TIGR01784 family)
MAKKKKSKIREPHQKGEIYVDPTYDWSFKRIFLAPGREDVLQTFLNDVLKGELQVAQIKGITHPPKEEQEDKAIFFDILCEDDQGRQFIVEMQRRDETGFLKRLDFYRSRAIAKQLRPKVPYQDLLPVAVVAICNFEILGKILPGKKTGKLYFERLALVGLESGLRAQDFPVMFHILDLKAYRRLGFPQHNGIEEWFELFTCVDRGEHPLQVHRAVITESLDRLEFLKLPQEERALAEKEIDQELRLMGMVDAAKTEGIQIGEERGIQIGEERGIQASARRLLKKGFTPQEVSDSLEMDLKDVLKLM